ncbi:MAG TPA: hypothetical protein VGK99_09930 [Acidobacteriota bacterium]|jgi:hypothetical protein
MKNSSEKSSRTHNLEEAATAALFITAAGFSIFLARNLQYRTAYALAAILVLFASVTVLELVLRNRPNRAKLLSRISGIIFLAYFFAFFVAGLVLWGRFSNPVFQTRLLVFAAACLALMAAVHARKHFSDASYHQKMLHSNTFYFGLVFAMSVFMMKYRDPSKVDAIGIVSLGLFSLLQAVTLLKAPPALKKSKV